MLRPASLFTKQDPSTYMSRREKTSECFASYQLVQQKIYSKYVFAAIAIGLESNKSLKSEISPLWEEAQSTQRKKPRRTLSMQVKMKRLRGDGAIFIYSTLSAHCALSASSFVSVWLATIKIKER